MRTQIVALCLLVLTVGVSSSESASANLKLSLAQLRSGYAVDRVVSLLQALYAVQADHLQTLVDNWAQTQPALQSAIDDANALVAQQTTNCNIIGATLTFSANQIALYQTYINQATNSIASNQASLLDKQTNRCAANLIFINRLKDNQDTLALLTYLLGKVSDPSFKAYVESSSSAFFELKSVTKANMFSFLAKHQLKMLIQQSQADSTNYQGESDSSLDYTVSTRSNPGTGQIDNSVGTLTLESWVPGQVGDIDLFISQLVDLINTLINQINSSNQSLQNAELSSVEAFIEYESQLERENTVLQKFITQWGGHINDLQATQAQNQQAEDDCTSQDDSLEEAASEKQAQLDAATALFTSTKASLDGTLALLDQVIQVYVTQVADASEVYKQEVDSWLSAHDYTTN